MKDNDEVEISGQKTSPETITQSPQQKNGSTGEKNKPAFKALLIAQVSENFIIYF